MTDFRDRFEQQLVAAAQRLAETAPVLPAQAAPPAPLRRRLPRRAVLVLALVAVLGGSAVATVTHPWLPMLGTPEMRVHPRIAIDAPPADQLAVLGVLRRDANAEDHGPAVQDALHYFGGSEDGIRTDFVRRLDHSGGAPVVLVPGQRWTGFGWSVRDPLCVFAAEPNGDGGGSWCFRLSAVLHGRAIGALGPRVIGLVPDGVATVDVHFAGGRVEPTTVIDNFFEVNAPTGDKRGFLWVTWRDAHGAETPKR